MQVAQRVKLYRVQRADLPRLEQLLYSCFIHDPLYETLIPDQNIRKRLMPKLFHCDMDEFYETCEIFSDSTDLNSILVVSDEAEPYNLFRFYFSEVKAALATDTCLIREDPSLKTFSNFLRGEDYLNSRWTAQLHQNKRLHIIYLAVDPRMQHHNIAAMLMNETIEYAQRNGMLISLETHNAKNLDFYRHFGFKVYGVVEKGFPLKQYCMIREVQ
ncbi:MAG: GNAT family N-acetyltransferase [bacterium]|nr:GNAT family N-acetyltransferase [bacterium]